MTLQLPARVIRFNKRTNYGRFQRAVQHSFVTLPSLPPQGWTNGDTRVCYLFTCVKL